MLYKAYILEINDTTFKIRVPDLEKAGNNTQCILYATMSYQPGNINDYKKGDVVFISFEADEYSKPVILGKLYLTPTNEAYTNNAILNSLKVKGSSIVGDLIVKGKLTLGDNLLFDNITSNNITINNSLVVNGTTTLKDLVINGNLSLNNLTLQNLEVANNITTNTLYAGEEITIRGLSGGVKENIDEIKSDITGLTTDITNIKSDISTIKEKNATQDTQIETNTSDIINIKEENATQNAQIKKANDNISDLTKGLTNLETNVETNTSDISTLKNDVSIINEKNLTQDTQIEEINNNMSGLAEHVDIVTMEVDTNTKDISTIETDISNLKNENTTQNNQIKQMNDSVVTLEQDVTNLTNQQATNTSDISNLKTQQATNTGDITTIKKDVTYLENKLQDTGNDVIGNMYNLGAYDTIVKNSDGSYTITRQTGYLNTDDVDWGFANDYDKPRWYYLLNDAFIKSEDNNTINDLKSSNYTVKSEAEAWNSASGVSLNGGSKNIVVFSEDKPIGYFQYKLASSYTETLEEKHYAQINQHFDTILDIAKGSENLYDDVQGEMSNPPSEIKLNLEPNTVYTLYISSNQNYTYSTGHWYIYNDSVGPFLDGILTNQAYTFTTPSNIPRGVVLWWWSGTFKSGTYYFMLNKGTRPLPYQPYKGGSVAYVGEIPSIKVNNAVSADTAKSVETLKATFLTSSSKSDEVEQAYRDFINKQIPIYLNGKIANIVTSSLIQFAFISNERDDTGTRLGGYHYVESFENNGNTWTYHERQFADSLVIKDYDLIYTGMQRQYGIELHFKLQLKSDIMVEFGVKEIMRTLNNYNETTSNHCYSTLINGFVIYNGAGFLPMLSLEFDYKTELLKVTYSDMGNYRVASAGIDFDSFTIEREIGYPNY